MNTPAQKLLGRLSRVRAAHGGNAWQACCPAHKDKSPSLSIKELPDGKLLLHCFAGCEVADIVAAVGLELSDLFPEKLNTPEGRSHRQHFHALNILKAIPADLTFAFLACKALSRGEALQESDRARLLATVSSIREALELGGHHVN